MWVWISNAINSLVCFRNKETDFDVVSEHDLQEDIYRTKVIYRDNREILAIYYGSSWETMEYWHKKGIHLVWTINILSDDPCLGFDGSDPDHAISIASGPDS